MVPSPAPTAARHLARAPIVEATLYVAVQPRPDVTAETLAALRTRLATRYPSRETRLADAPFGALGRSVERPDPAQGRQPVGYVFTSSDGRNVVQARTDGLSVSRLRPYTTWEDLLAEARRVWSDYAEVAGAERARYIGLRYINRFVVPPSARYEDYLRTRPVLSPGLGGTPAVFFMLFTLPRRDPESVATITVSSGTPRDGEEGAPVVFDVDLSANATPDMLGEGMWNAFAGLREIKNQIFFESMTDRAWETFQ